MKSVYKATLLATATTLICGFASAGSQNGAERDGWRARTVPFQAEMAIPPSAPAARSFDATQTPRLPVLMLTQSYGDSARELFAGGAVPYTLRNFPFKSTKTIVYLDADTFNPRSRLNREALALAKEAGWPVVIESDTWNAKRVAELAAVLFPEAARAKLSNTSVIVEASANGVSVRDTWPSEVAAKAGVPYGDTSESTMRNGLAKVTGTPIHWSAPFANAAYLPRATDIVYEGTRWQIGINNDIVKTWVYWNPQIGPQCIVAWRGSNDPGDWVRNAQNAVLKPIPGISDHYNLKIGYGYGQRLQNANLDMALQCREVYSTGHSLGGGMAQAYALRELFQRGPNSTPETIKGVYAYNPARFTNEIGAQTLQALRTGRYELKTFCRYNDFVWYLPALLKHGTSDMPGTKYECTNWGERVSWNPKTNHSMENWWN